MSRRTSILLVVLAAVFLTACIKNAITGRSQLLIFSSDEMTQLGAQAYAEMTGPESKAKVSTDERLTAPLMRVGRAISTTAEALYRPGYEWEFKVIDDPKTINAWALPGGKIAFYTGIYPILKDEAGMAIVMGHEVMHAILDHGNERMSQSSVAEGLAGAAGVALKDNKYRDVILTGVGLGAQVGVLLPFSRRHETEADEQGLYLAAEAGYDPEAAIGVWERMAALGGGGTPEILSTHPGTENRIAKMRQWMPEAKRRYALAKVKRENKPLPALP